MKSDPSVRAEASRLLADEWRARARVLRRSDSDPYAGDTADVIEEMAGELEARKLEGPDPETITRLQQLVTEWKCEAFADGVKAVASAQRGDPLSDVLLACAKISQGHANQLLALLSQISPAQESR
jgi:hypothetical protein